MSSRTCVLGPGRWLRCLAMGPKVSTPGVASLIVGFVAGLGAASCMTLLFEHFNIESSGAYAAGLASIAAAAVVVHFAARQYLFGAGIILGLLGAVFWFLLLVASLPSG